MKLDLKKSEENRNTDRMKKMGRTEETRKGADLKSGSILGCSIGSLIMIERNLSAPFSILRSCS